MSHPIRKICVVGIGYIGLPTAGMFAKAGYEVVGVDVNASAVEKLNRGEIGIEEPGLPELIAETVASGRLRASTVPERADVFFICVGTPIKEDHTADMRAVKAATESIVPYIEEGNIVILESTSPPGTVEKLMLPILNESGIDCRAKLHLAHSPERVFPGKILSELVTNNRIVGGLTREAAELVAGLYRSFVKGDIILTDATTAELCKLMENTFRDVNIALANELAKICDTMGLNVWEVIALANNHPRVNFLQPGPGVGGHCIAVDPWFVVEKAPGQANIIALSRETNDSMPSYTANAIASLLGHQTAGKKAALLGVTFKPDTDDTRESPIWHLISRLRGMGMTVAAHDPHVKDHPELVGYEEAIKDADLVVLCVHHSQFKNLDFPAMRAAVKTPLVFDTRNFWDHAALEALGFTCRVLGNGGSRSFR